MEAEHRPHRLTRRQLALATLGAAAAMGTSSMSRAADPATTIFRGPTTVPIVALTFDGGSDAGYCGSILDTLANATIKATFPLTGQFAVANPHLVKRIVDEGHQLVNHSWSHPSFTGVSSSVTALTLEARTQELTSTEEAFVNAAGVTAKPWFRPPFGDYNSSALADLGTAGYSKCLLWSIDLMGWNGYTQTQIVNRVDANHGNGYIYLMHVGSQSQEGPALTRIISLLQQKGYGFATVEALLAGTSPPPPPPPAPFAIGDTVRVTAALNLRTAPNLGGRIIKTLSTGTTATVLAAPVPADGHTWLQLQTPSGIGWAATINLVKVASTPPPTPTPTPSFVIGDTVRVTAGLYLRSAPATNSQAYLTMPTGTLCTIVGGPAPSNGYTWYEVQTQYGAGWAAGEYLAKSGGTVPTPPPTPGAWPAGTRARVTESLRLRATPSTSGRILTTMPRSTIVTVVSGPRSANGYTWYQVQSSYGTGWAASMYLSKLD